MLFEIALLLTGVNFIPSSVCLAIRVEDEAAKISSYIKV